jgi:hypothetical protein
VKHKVSELEGVRLNAAVARCEGYAVRGEGDKLTWHAADGSLSNFNPAGSWAHGGPIIEREQIAFRYDKAQGCSEACISPDSDYDTFVRGRASYATGPTTLIACMRAYVSSKFGEEVDL